MGDIGSYRKALPDGGSQSSIEEMIEGAVARAIEQLLKPYLVRLSEPEPLVYTVTQAATVLQVSPDTIARLVKRGVLPRVPHLDGKLLVPRVALDRLLSDTASATADFVTDTSASAEVSPLPIQRIRRQAIGP